MGQAAIRHGISRLWLQPLRFKACLVGLLDRQLPGGFCFRPGLGCLAGQLLLLAGIRWFISICGIGSSLCHRSFSRCGLLGAITGSGSGGFCFQGFARPADRRQPVLSPLQLLGKITAQLPLAVLAVLLGIQDLDLAQQLPDLLLQLGLGLEHPLVAHGLVLTGIGLHLGAIQRHKPQAHHAGFLAEPQDLHKQITERLKVATAELTDAGVVRLLVAGQHPEGQVLVAGPLDLVPPARWPAAR
jgi:hypothetical protein